MRSDGVEWNDLVCRLWVALKFDSSTLQHGTVLHERARRVRSVQKFLVPIFEHFLKSLSGDGPMNQIGRCLVQGRLFVL